MQPYDQLKERFGWELVCANTTEVWYALLKGLMEDPEKLERLKKRASRLAEESFGVEAIAQDFKETLFQLCINRPAGHISVLAFCGLKGWNALVHIISGVKRNGLRTPLVALKKMNQLIKR